MPPAADRWVNSGAYKSFIKESLGATIAPPPGIRQSWTAAVHDNTSLLDSLVRGNSFDAAPRRQFVERQRARESTQSVGKSGFSHRAWELEPEISAYFVRRTTKGRN